MYIFFNFADKRIRRRYAFSDALILSMNSLNYKSFKTNPQILEFQRQLAKRGTGIMSSLYNSTSNDANMTLELSLEINRKLQGSSRRHYS